LKGRLNEKVFAQYGAVMVSFVKVLSDETFIKLIIDVDDNNSLEIMKLLFKNSRTSYLRYLK